MDLCVAGSCHYCLSLLLLCITTVVNKCVLPWPKRLARILFWKADFKYNNFRKLGNSVAISLFYDIFIFIGVYYCHIHYNEAIVTCLHCHLLSTLGGKLVKNTSLFLILYRISQSTKKEGRRAVQPTFHGNTEIGSNWDLAGSQRLEMCVWQWVASVIMSLHIKGSSTSIANHW